MKNITLCRLNFKRGRCTFSPKKRAPRNAKSRGRGINYPFEIGDEYEVDVEEMSPNGEGIAKIKGFPVFIGNAKANEHLRVRITKIISGCADAEIIPQ